MEENSMYRDLLQRERDLQMKVKNFIESIIEQWMRSFDKEDFLHLNDPLLRKEKRYYVINVKSEVRLMIVSRI